MFGKDHFPGSYAFKGNGNAGNSRNTKHMTSECSAEKESPLSQFPSNMTSPSSQMSQVFVTAMQYPPTADTKTVFKSGKIDEMLIHEDEEEDSPLFPNWEKKFQPTLVKLAKEGTKTESSLLSSIGAGSPFQNPFQRNPSVWSNMEKQNDGLQKEGKPPLNNETGSTTLVDDSMDKIRDTQKNDKKMNTHRTSKICCGFTLLLLLCLIPSIFAILLPSCRTTNGMCFPQFSLQLDDSSANATEALNLARSLVRIVSYIAIDLGSPYTPSSTDNPLTDENYLDTIDTFSYGNIYGLSFHGYCRDNIITGSRFCTECTGINVISTLIRDSGIQLAKVAKRRDFKSVGDSFVLGYKVMLKKYDSMYTNTDLVDKISSIELLTTVLADLTIFSFAFSLFNVAYITFLLIVITCQRPTRVVNHLRTYALFLLIFEFLEFVILFFIWSIEFIYVYKLAEVCSTSGIAVVAWDLGMYILAVSLLISCCAFLYSFIFYKINRR